MNVPLLLVSFVVLALVFWCWRLDAALARLLDLEQVRLEAEAERLRPQTDRLRRRGL